MAAKVTDTLRHGAGEVSLAAGSVTLASGCPGRAEHTLASPLDQPPEGSEDLWGASSHGPRRGRRGANSSMACVRLGCRRTCTVCLNKQDGPLEVLG